MYNRSQPAGVVSLNNVGRYYKRSKYAPFLPVQEYYLTTLAGLVVYYDDHNKHSINKWAKQLSMDLKDASEKKNTGYFVGLELGLKKNGDYFVKATPYKLLSVQEVEEYKNQISTPF